MIAFITGNQLNQTADNCTTYPYCLVVKSKALCGCDLAEQQQYQKPAQTEQSAYFRMEYALYRHVLAVFVISTVSEVTCSMDNVIVTNVGVIDLNPQMRTDFSTNSRSEQSHSRVKRSTGYTSSESQAILDKHNELRSQVSPEASDMIFMEWDDDLATMAQQWSDMCIWDHGQPTNISPFDPLGQNLWLGTGNAGNPPDGVSSTQAWYNEVNLYTYDTRDCSGVCGHYTQVVWADSYAVGCGRAFCATTDSGQTNVWIVTCNYGPAGNHNRHPYVAGPSCTDCSSGIGQCFNNQCRSCSEHNFECVCNQQCINCGVVDQATCTCTCPNGYYGNGCSVPCEDTNSLCYNGWYPPQCDSVPQAVTGCPMMCGICTAPDPDFVCITQPTECPCTRRIPPGL